MSTETDLGALIERVEKATGPDREISLAVPQALGYVWNGVCSSDNPHGRWEHPDTGAWLNDLDYTSSLDAVVALVERQRVHKDSQLPWQWSVDSGVGEPHATIFYRLSSRVKVEAVAATPALALLLAFLRARQAAAAGGA